jgi:hypothetical protein
MKNGFCCSACPTGESSWWWLSPSDHPGLVSFLRDGPLGMSGGDMKKNSSRKRRTDKRDTMRPEYDFSRAVRGVTAARYAQGANVVVIDPDILDVFPTGASVNEALRALAPVLRQNRPVAARRRSA